MPATLILPSWLIADAPAAPQKDWGVRVEGDQITDVAPNDELRQKYPGDAVHEAPGQVLSPGFNNAHSHLYGVLAHGIPMTKAPSGFWPFLEDFWWPLVEDRLDHAMVRAATDLRCADMLKSGVTSFYDCTEAPYSLPGVLPAQAEVVRKWGLRAILSFEATQRVSAENGQLGQRENADFVDACKRAGGLVNGLMCVHTTFTCDADFIRQAYAMAQERGVLLHAHVSEGTYEPQYAQEKFGMRPLHYYEKLGVAGPGFLASQCVQLDESEIDLIARTGTRVSHMPLSNCEVGGGIAPAPDYVARNVTLGLGSDGYIDDFFAVMRGAFLIHKAYRLDPRLMPADVVWGLATNGGAAAMGYTNVGRIRPGWQADLQLIHPNLPTPIEGHNLYDQLLLYCSAANVRWVMVAGQVKVQDFEVLGADWEELHANTRQQAERLWSFVR